MRQNIFIFSTIDLHYDLVVTTYIKFERLFLIIVRHYLQVTK